MPRVTKVETPGCPPLRALTTDALGLIKVVEVHGKIGTPKVVETWGCPDVSRSVLATSFADRQINPLLAVARKNGVIELLNPLNGDALATILTCELRLPNRAVEEDSVAGLHLFRRKSIDLSSRSSVLLTCTEKGKACLRSFSIPEASTMTTSENWNVSTSGKVTCTSVNFSENYALFGGKGIELNICDLENHIKIWISKPPHVNNLGIFSPTYFTAATFVDKEDHRKIVAGTSNYQIRLYDISAQRRPVASIDFRESPIKVVTEDPNGHTVYVGTGIGDLASFDIRTGKMIGCFLGKCCGSIRSIARHPELPLLASCGLDSYLRIWDCKTRQLISAVFLKQHLTNVVIDSHFSSGVHADDATDQSHDLIAETEMTTVGLVEIPKKLPKRSANKTKKVVENFELSSSEDEGAIKQTLSKKTVSSKVKNNKNHKKRKIKGSLAIES